MNFKFLILLALSAIAWPAAAQAACPPIPFIFAQGAPFNATQVNANFTSLRDCYSTSLSPGTPPTVVNHPVVWTDTLGTGIGDPGTTWTYGGSIVLNPVPGSLNQGLKTSQTVAGTVVADTWYNQFLIASDNVSGAQTNLFGGGVYHICCGAAAQGYRFALGGRLDVTGAWSSSDPEAVFVGVIGNARATVSASSVGALIAGGNFNVDVSNNAQNWATVIGAETDVIVRAGTEAPQMKTNQSHVLGALDAVNAFGFSAWHHYVNAGTTNGMTNLWLLDTTLGGGEIVEPVGTILNVRGAMTVAEVFNLNSLTVTGNVLTGPGGSSVISGAGAGHFSCTLSGNGNIWAVYPASAATGWALGSNFSAANAEVNLWNTSNAGLGFHFKQKTGASAASDVFWINNTTGGNKTTNVKLMRKDGAGVITFADVTVDANDSCGAGFSCLRVIN